MSEVIPFVCPAYENAFNIMLHGIDNAHLYSSVAPPRTKIWFYGQNGIGKVDQLSYLVAQKTPQMRVYEVILKPSREAVSRTAADILQWFHTDNNDKKEKALVIRNAHLLLDCLTSPNVMEVLDALPDIPQGVMAISDAPIEGGSAIKGPVYAAFQMHVCATLPTQEYLRVFYAQHFAAWAAHCLSVGSVSRIELTGEEDTLWLAQCSDFCTPDDALQFISRTIYTSLDNPETRIDRDYVENLDNKLMFSSQDHEGVLSITMRPARQAQSMFMSANNMACIPASKKRPRNE